MKGGRPAARGLESGNTGLHQPYPILVAKGSIFGRPIYKFLDAGETATRFYAGFLTKIPAGYNGVGAVTYSGGKLVVRKRERAGWGFVLEVNTMDELKDADSIRAHYGEPSHMAKAKQLARLDQHCRAFIHLSPFLVVATTDADGRVDVSPRGDAPGFVAVLDDKTLVVPDRVGNRRADTMLNVTANAHIALLFLVPGINETLRVNGTARVTVDPAVLAPLAANGKLPTAAVAS